MMIIYMRVYTQHPDLLSLLAKSFTEETEENRNIVLEILETLPELMTDEKVVIEDELRAKFIEYAMQNLQAGVLKTLSDASAVPDLSTRRRYQLLNCFHAWMIEQTPVLVKKNIHVLNLLPLCFKELTIEDGNNEEAADAIIACMVITKDSENYPDLYKCIMEGLFRGKNAFDKFVKDEMSEEVAYYISVYSVLVSRIFNEILNGPTHDEIRFMLEGVFLKVLQVNKGEMVSKTTVAITSIIKKLQVDEQATPEKLQKIANFTQIYQPWFEQVIDAACTHCRLTEVRTVH